MIVSAGFMMLLPWSWQTDVRETAGCMATDEPSARTASAEAAHVCRVRKGAVARVPPVPSDSINGSRESKYSIDAVLDNRPREIPNAGSPRVPRGAGSAGRMGLRERIVRARSPLHLLPPAV